MLFVVVVVLILALGAQAALQFAQGPLQSLSYAAPATALHLGPQLNVTVSGRLLYLPQVDPCAPSDDLSVAGQIVMVGVGTCSPEHQYDAWAERGVSALISYGPYQPGGMYCYMQDGVAQHSGLLYVQVYEDAALMQYLDSVTESEHVQVRVEPDPNPWVDLYRSPAYQLLARFLPASIYAFSSGMAGVFLYRNVAQLQARYHSTPTHYGRQGWVAFLRKNVGSSQVALFVRAVTSALVAVIRVSGGYFSTSNLSGPVQRFFFQELWGVTAATALIVSSIWNTARQKVAPSRTLSVRLLTGEFRALTVFMFGYLLALELIVSLSYATYYFNALLRYLSILEIINTLTLLTVALQFLSSAVQLRALVRNNPSSSINDYVARMSRLVTLLGVLMFLLVCMFMIMGGDPDIWNPPKFFLVMTVTSLLHATACIVITLLLKPQDGDGKKSPNTTHKPVLPTGEKASTETVVASSPL